MTRHDGPRPAESAAVKTQQARYDFAVGARELELDLFWKRSLFFWGFTSAAFVAYVNVRGTVFLGTLVASFGVVCSAVWTLANRGSKFWYENWETKLERTEGAVTGPWFGVPEGPKPDSAWLRGQHVSVSKLAIALSDYMTFLWGTLLVSRIAILVFPDVSNKPYPAIAAGLFAATSVLFAVSLRWVCRSKHSKSK